LDHFVSPRERSHPEKKMRRQKSASFAEQAKDDPNREYRRWTYKERSTPERRKAIDVENEMKKSYDRIPNPDLPNLPEPPGGNQIQSQFLEMDLEHLTGQDVTLRFSQEENVPFQFEDIPIQNWTQAHVIEWFGAMGIDPNQINLKLDGKALLRLTEYDIKGMNNLSPEQKKILLKELKYMQTLV